MDRILSVLNLAAQVALVFLVTDFVSGVFHWWEDTYGDPFWPVTGAHVTRPNILHHYAPRAILEKSWFVSARALLVIAGAIALAAWSVGLLTWQVALGLALGANMNQIHKWSHRSPRDNPAAIRALQRLGVLQSPAHHRRHHDHRRNTNYCILTDYVNPLLDAVGFWARAEQVIERVFGVRRCNEAERAAMVLAREPEFFGVHLPVVRRRVADELARERGEVHPLLERAS